MEYKIFDQLKAAIETLSDKLTDSVDEIHREKVSIQNMYEAANIAADRVHYVRDNDTLILSAPNVIIGNVDKFGRLLPGQGHVTVRGHAISNEASDFTGSITNRATTIKNIAVDPGIDGLENTVHPGSWIANQAAAVTLQSNNDKEAFSHDPVATSGILISSDSIVSVEANANGANHKKTIEGKASSCQTVIKNETSAASAAKAKLVKTLNEMTKLLMNQEKYNGSIEGLSSNYQELYGTQHEQFKFLEHQLYDQMLTFLDAVGRKLEGKRCSKAFETQKGKIKSGDDFKKKSTATAISMKSEAFSIVSTDGDGNYRENKEAGLSVNVPHVSVNANDKQGKLIKDSSIVIGTQDFVLSTANPAYNDEKREAGQFPATGSVTVTSKEVTIQAIDNELKDKKIQEKALTAGGKVSVRAENVSLTTNATDGKANGKLTLNAKTMNIAAMDVDKDKRTDKEMAEGSKLTVLAEKTLIGTTKKTKLVQLAAEKLALIGKDTAELQQDGKAVVTASGGSVTAGGSKVELQGDTTISGNADIKGEAKAPKVTGDQVEASSAFKSPNINDTMGVGVAAPAGQPSAKLKEEEAKTN